MKKIVIAIAFVMASLGVQPQKANAYLVASILIGDFNHLSPRMTSQDKTACTLLFMFCYPYLALGDNTNGDNALAGIDQIWLNDNGYSEADVQLVLSDLKKLNSHKKVIIFDKTDTGLSIKKALLEIEPSISQKTIDVALNYLGIKIQ
jgi:hypothetical protein